MNKKSSVTVVAALLLVNACGPHVGVPETSVGDVAESSATSTSVVEALAIGDDVTDETVNSTIATTTQGAVDESPSAEGESVESAAASERPTTSSVVPTTSSTTTTTASSVPETTTTTQPPAEVDLEALNQALDELDALLGLFDSQIDVVDLDETEGETP